jgi:RNA polymerase sigma-70 factor (ECF subfamily)
MRMDPLNDEMTVMLIEHARTGRDAFEKLVARYQQDVFRIIRVYTQNDSDAEDLAQETWIKVYQSFRKLKDPHRFESWLKTIAVNTAKNWLRSRAHKESEATDTVVPRQLWGSAMLEYQQQGLIEKIRGAVDSLSAKNREVVYDFYICGYSAAQISQRLNVPISTVNSRLKEARQQLREEFATMVAMSRIQQKFAPDTFSKM